MISLFASASYGNTGQYVARLTGRDSKFTFAREFLGRKGGKRNEDTTADVDEPGVYECCDVGKRGKESRYRLLIDIGGDLLSAPADKEDAMTICKALDAGRPFAEIVEGWEADDRVAPIREDMVRLGNMTVGQLRQFDEGGQFPAIECASPENRDGLAAVLATLQSLKAEGVHFKRGYRIVPAAEAKKAVAARTQQEAIEACMAILGALPAPEAKKVLATLKARLSPAKVEASTAS